MSFSKKEKKQQVRADKFDKGMEKALKTSSKNAQLKNNNNSTTKKVEENDKDNNKVDFSNLVGKVNMVTNKDVCSVHLENVSTVEVSLQFSGFADEQAMEEILKYLNSSQQYKDSSVQNTLNIANAKWSLGNSGRFIVTPVSIIFAETEPGDYRFVQESIQTLVNFLSNKNIGVNQIDGFQKVTSPVQETYNYYINSESRLTHEKE